MLFYILNVGNAIQVLTRIGFWVISPILAWVAVVTSLNLLFGLN